MKNAKREMKREGFTLVELLIVIVVIGVLSAMMMLSSTEAVSSAKAADIVSDLRNLKTAALAYYADNLDTAGASDFKVATSSNADLRKSILKYMNNASADAKYQFYDGNNNNEWYVGCSVSDGKVQEKLAGRAKSTGLLKTTVSNDTYVVGSSNNTVYMFIR